MSNASRLKDCRACLYLFTFLTPGHQQRLVAAATQCTGGNMHSRAFSLVELSIVLVILGLLTGGILTGQNLIRAAELRSLMTETQRYQSAIYTFRDKYFAIPGDMANASAFWGHQTPAGSCTNNSGAADSASGVCDGNADARINTTSTLNRAVEEYQFWRHLVSAGLIEGNFTGMTGTSELLVQGENVPLTRLSGGRWRARMFNAADPASTATDAFAVDMGGTLQVGATDNTSNFLLPEEVWGIDKKVDDGKPGRGKIIARPWDTGCTNAADRTDLGADYLLTTRSSVCTFYISAF
jgi:prepilin-type N-terminal cleavage/methylation domain-containing protein